MEHNTHALSRCQAHSNADTLQNERMHRQQAEQELQHRIAFEHIIIAISTTFINLPPENIDRGIHQALQKVGEFAGVERSYVFRYADDYVTMSNTHEWCADHVESVYERMQQVPVSSFAWSNDLLMQNDMLSVSCIAHLPPEAAHEREAFERQSIQSRIAVPMVSDNTVIGFLGLDALHRAIVWDNDCMQLLTIVGQIFVNAMARKQADDVLRQSQYTLEQRVEERTRQLTTLLNVQHALSSRLDLDSVLQMIAEEGCNLTGATFAAVFVREGDQLRVVTLAGAYSDGMHIGYCMPIAASATGLALLTGNCVRIDSLDDARVYIPAMHRACSQSLIGVPLISDTTAIGVLSVGHCDVCAFTADDEHVLTMLASGAVIALENVRLYNEAQEAAAMKERQRLARELHDAVTQTLFSTSLIADVLPRLWERDREQGKARLDDLRQLTRGALAEMRALLLELRPTAIYEARLGDLLHQLSDAVTGRARLPIHVHITGDVSLPADVQVAFYRIAQESLNNVIKHANASLVTLHLFLQPDNVSMRICDNGEGFDGTTVDPRHFGVSIMRERATSIGATIAIESEPNDGTCITVVWHPEQTAHQTPIAPFDVE